MQVTPIVFLIDDDTDDQEIFSLAISKAHGEAACVFANDGIEALDILKNDPGFMPDYIFIDMNMPKMNGQQCLEQIKKIERIKHVPVYIYSTSADPESIKENKRLGAIDFIVKPSSLTELTNILKNIIREPLMALVFLFCLFGFQSSYAQSDQPVRDLKKLSMDELINITVTSVTKTPENITEVASAIQVITGSDIKRSTATRLPEALRLTPNLQVAQTNSHDWGISARGFNGAPVSGASLADKLLVMIDGRTVYTPLFGGVFWDVQNVYLEDIDRIEVVSGPGGTLWGSNAVNGVINVITKSAKETQGLHASGILGDYVRNQFNIRYGGQVDSSLFYRVNLQRLEYGNTHLPNGVDVNDAWNMLHGGFRVDFMPGHKNTFTLQGEAYGGEEGEMSPITTNGQYLLGRWNHTFNANSNISLQTYFDRTFREIEANPFTDELITFDFDLQHSYTIGSHSLLYGIGYRNQNDVTTSDDNRFTPANRTLEQISGFIQDQIALSPKFTVTAGSKFLTNEYTGLEIQPSLRLAYLPGKVHTVWAAVSRAVRTPSRFDVEISSFQVADVPEFESEEVIAYEVGYRMQPFDKVSLSIAAFYNQYDDLRSLNVTQTPEPAGYFGNDLKATTWGFEVSGNAALTEWWRIRGGLSFLQKDFEIVSENVFPGSELIEAIDPQGQVLVHSIMNITPHLEFDLLGRYIDALPALTLTQTPEVDSYFALNLRLAYDFNSLEVSLTGQNLLEDYHTEFGTFQIPRSIYGKIIIRL